MLHSTYFITLCNTKWNAMKQRNARLQWVPYRTTHVQCKRPAKDLVRTIKISFSNVSTNVFDQNTRLQMSDLVPRPHNVPLASVCVPDALSLLCTGIWTTLEVCTLDGRNIFTHSVAQLHCLPIAPTAAQVHRGLRSRAGEIDFNANSNDLRRVRKLSESNSGPPRRQCAAPACIFDLFTDAAGGHRILVAEVNPLVKELVVSRLFSKWFRINLRRLGVASHVEGESRLVKVCTRVFFFYWWVLVGWAMEEHKESQSPSSCAKVSHQPYCIACFVFVPWVGGVLRKRRASFYWTYLARYG